MCPKIGPKIALTTKSTVESDPGTRLEDGVVVTASTRVITALRLQPLHKSWFLEGFNGNPVFF